MQQVHVRVTNPAIPCEARLEAVQYPAVLIRNVVVGALICAFWGTIVFLALTAAVR